MHHVLIMGAGKIGSLIAFLLAHSKDYMVYLADIITDNPHILRLSNIPNLKYLQLDAKQETALSDFVVTHKIEALISSLPYYQNSYIAKVAADHKIHYFDLTEDRETTTTVRQLAQDAASAFVPQCGLAPGFINVIAHHLMKNFSSLQSVKMRVGALPVHISNALQYALTWSTDGLINEYGNLCQVIDNKKTILVQPLEGLEEIMIDGLTYEAFNTSGGIGSLVESYAGKVNHMSYKTIRYPGHCDKIKFLMNDLKLNQNRELLKNILENAIPKTYQDVVLVYVSVNGLQNEQFIEASYVKKFYPKTIMGQSWTAIQLTTASEICIVIDLVFNQPNKYKGFVPHELFLFEDIIKNRFGQYYA